MSPPPAPRLPRRAAVLLCLLFAALHWHTTSCKSPTWDEVGYLGLGAYLLSDGQWDVPAAGSHPPLAYYLHGLPLFLFPVDWEVWESSRGAADPAALRSADIGRGNALLLDPHYDGELLLQACRTTSLVLAVILAVLVARWAQRLGGPWAGVAALFFLALSPNLLAHATLITPDFPLTVLFFAAVIAVRRMLLQPHTRNAVVAGIAVGGALLAKLSGLLVLPVGLVLTLWHVGRAAPGDVHHAASWSRLWPTPGSPAARLARLWALAGAVAVAVVVVAYHLDPRPYADVVRSQLWDLSSGHRAYLMGEISDRGWWYYYPVAFLLKTPLPALVLVPLGAAGLWRRSPRHRLELGFLAIPPLLFASAFVLSTGKDIGLRYILPIYPFLFVLAGVGLVRVASAARPWRLALASALCIWYAAGAARIHPHHLAYLNEFAGGPDNGYLYLADSNLDWGQDLKGLARYLRERGAKSVKLSYFGTVDPALYGLEYEWLPSYVLPKRGHPVADFPPTGLVAVSVTNLVGVYMDMYPGGPDLYAWLRDVEPVARIGHSIHVYDLPAPPDH